MTIELLEKRKSQLLAAHTDALEFLLSDEVEADSLVFVEAVKTEKALHEELFLVGRQLRQMRTTRN